MAPEQDRARKAREAIEIVCTGDLSRMSDYYHPDFVDHVNDMTFHGYQGGQESVSFYKAIFRDLWIGVEEQLLDGDRVASRWVLRGTYHRRPITLRGITISRFAEDGYIVEDRGHTDTIALLRQLGPARALLLAVEVLVRRVKLPRNATAGGREGPEQSALAQRR